MWFFPSVNVRIELIDFDFTKIVSLKTSAPGKNQILKTIFTPILVSQKLPTWPCSGLIYSRFEDFIQNAENVTQIIYAWQNMRKKKLFQIEMRSEFCTDQNFTLDFRFCPKFIVFRYFPPKLFNMEYRKLESFKALHCFNPFNRYQSAIEIYFFDIPNWSFMDLNRLY